MNHKAQTIEEAVGTTREQIFEYAEKHHSLDQIVDDAVNGVPEAIAFVTIGLRNFVIAFQMYDDYKLLTRLFNVVKAYDIPTEAVEAMLSNHEEYRDVLKVAAECMEVTLKEGEQ